MIPSASSQAIELQKQERNSIPSSHTPQNTLFVVDPNTGRRHSMDTTLDLSQLNNSNVVKSHSTGVHLDTKETGNVSDQLPIPAMNRKKSVSSKERLFSVESVRRRSSTKSVEQLVKTAPTGQSADQSESIKRDEPSSLTSLKQSSLTVNPFDHVRRACLVVISFRHSKSNRSFSIENGLRRIHKSFTAFHSTPLVRTSK